MAEETEGAWFVISVGAAFLAGLVSLFAFFWLRGISREANLGAKGGEMTGSERLEYYEKQLVDMKIRLDALEMMGIRQANGSDNGMMQEGGMQHAAGAVLPPRLLEGLERLLLSREQGGEESKAAAIPADSAEPKVDVDTVLPPEDAASGTRGKAKKSPIAEEFVPSRGFPSYPNPVDHVLHLITSNITTSRDIQITMKKSREHTSRLLKKMYEDGYLQRNEDNRPYTYSITPKGAERLEQATDNDAAVTQSVLK